MANVPKSLAVALGVAIALASLLATARPVAAAQNRPSWSEGDFWVYSRTAGTATSTVRMDVLARETLTLNSGTYSVWHITTTTTPSGGSATITHSWIVQESNLAIAKGNITFLGNDVQVTYDPPLILAVFPLAAGNSWSLNTTVRVVNTGFSFGLNYGASVTAEQTTTVTAGTFNVAVIRSPSTGNARTERHYSDAAGNEVREESYNGSGARTADQQLTSHRYRGGALGVLLILAVIGIVAAIGIAAIVALRRRARPRPMERPPMPPPSGP